MIFLYSVLQFLAKRLECLRAIGLFHQVVCNRSSLPGGNDSAFPPAIARETVGHEYRPEVRRERYVEFVAHFAEDDVWVIGEIFVFEDPCVWIRLQKFPVTVRILVQRAGLKTYPVVFD